MKVLVIDNHDSFTYNLVDLVSRVSGTPPDVVTNDAATVDDLRRMDLGAIIVSPGPGHPGRSRDFGVCAGVMTGLDVPVLGVCLGHQGLAHAFGAVVDHAPDPMHGRLSAVFHDGLDLFEGIPAGFNAVRYHSLVVSGPIPDELLVNAWTADGLVMAVRHRSRPLRGVQFHPESILTEHGERLMRNFLRLAADHRPASPGRPAVASSPLRPRAGPARPNGSAPPPSGPWRTRFRRLPSWIEPEEAFCDRYAGARHAFWLDSSLARAGLSRFSFMGAADGPESFVVTYDSEDRRLTVESPSCRAVRHGSIFDFLEEQLKERSCPPSGLPFEFNGGFVGWFGYELKRECGFTARHRSPLPDAGFIFADRLLAFDHEERVVYLVVVEAGKGRPENDAWLDATERNLRHVVQPPPVRARSRPRGVTFRPRRGGRGYVDDIRACLEEIRNGNSYEICLTNMLSTDSVDRPLDLYRILRRASPAPYAAYLRLDDLAVLSSSPERFLRIDASGAVSSKPIKGTAARSPNADEDQCARLRLGTSPKDRAENLMIVDLVRNDLTRVCEPGSVRVPSLMQVESYATVHQLVSTVTGQCRREVSALGCVRAAFPGGSMTGAPKARTIEILDRLEGGARGIYSGSIGWLGLSGAADLNIVIRTLAVTGTEMSFGVGGAIVAMSDPEGELEETILKGAALIGSVAKLWVAPGHAPEVADMEESGTPFLARTLSARAPTEPDRCPVEGALR